ncbi:sigma-54 interaction domain-containing protein [Desulfatitalea alkaliphila]|uniref:Sigma 54-interacting transcriptional regulator n=1 Tax=Desulfatitalea alkaliphila TaxID=2929485 RepID=A0AA41UKJ5_9BACT|nr:sigma 54-interacting transcriptional regulator [Desulfatitalea alkaliphila]MCJ8502379.1 sigma 54-interacting transcriptional regulator [Desulfatitalea alkaliphila]
MSQDDIRQISDALLYALLDNPYESLILIDAAGIVRFVSHANESVRGVSAQSAVGRHISEVSPDSELPRIIRTGKAEIGHSLVLRDRERIVARIPLTRDGQVIGAAGKLLLSSPEKVKALYQRIESLEKQLDYYKSAYKQIYGSRFTFDNIIGQSRKLQEAKALALKAAQNDSSVIILGESGTGKEMFAHAIHMAGPRAGRNFIRINCGAIPGELFESELFGYEPGAFTGARRQGAAGKIELGHKGTVFLDEISEMPLRMQVKLLRVLQDKVVERIGGGKPRQIDFRIISATHQDLESMIRQGTFRLDLFYRLNVMLIRLPALRTIPEDIPLIFNAILADLCRAGGRSVVEVRPDALAALCAYHWPGNVRELRNVAERALVVADGRQIDRRDLPGAVRGAAATEDGAPQAAQPLKAVLETAERESIVTALRQTDGNKAKAAALLGIHRTGLYQKMHKYQLL